MNTDIAKKIEALLYYAGEPVDISELQTVLGVSDTDMTEGLTELEKNLTGHGMVLVRHENTVMLATAPDCSEAIEKMIRTERESTLGRASLETLSIVAYKGPISKKEVEYIRGVNSDYAIRSLLLRGLIEKKQPLKASSGGHTTIAQSPTGYRMTADATDERVSLYTITSDTLLHLGISRIEDLPEYSSVKNELETHTKGDVVETKENTEDVGEENYDEEKMSNETENEVGDDLETDGE